MEWRLATGSGRASAFAAGGAVRNSVCEPLWDFSIAAAGAFDEPTRWETRTVFYAAARLNQSQPAMAADSGPSGCSWCSAAGEASWLIDFPGAAAALSLRGYRKERRRLLGC